VKCFLFPDWRPEAQARYLPGKTHKNADLDRRQPMVFLCDRQLFEPTVDVSEGMQRTYSPCSAGAGSRIVKPKRPSDGRAAP
jgi:hypothetical protein